MLKQIKRIFRKADIALTRSEIQSARYKISYLINDLNAVSIYSKEVGIELVEMIRDYGFTKEYDSFFHNNHYYRVVKIINKKKYEYQLHLFKQENNGTLYNIYEDIIKENTKGESLNLLIEKLREIYVYLLKMEVEL